jgi:hypothetical protein
MAAVRIMTFKGRIPRTAQADHGVVERLHRRQPPWACDPHEFAHPLGDNITTLQNSRGASKRGLSQ